MKKFVCFIFVCLCCLRLSGQAKSEPSDIEKRVDNATVMVGMTVENVLSNLPAYDVRTYVDTLYHHLYMQPAKISLASTFMGKINLQAFFALSGDSRIDYPDIERCLARTQKIEAFYTLPFVVCAVNYALWAEQQQLTDKETAALQIGLKAHNKLFPDSTTVFSSTMNIKLSDIYFHKKEWRSAAKYTERSLTDMRRMGEEGTEEYFELLSALGACYSLSGRHVLADSCLQVVQHHMEQTGQEATEEYVDLLIERAEIQETLGQYEASEALYLKARNGVAPTDEVYHDIMRQLVHQYSQREAYEKALDILQQELDYFEQKESLQASELLEWIESCNNQLATNEGQRFVTLLERLQYGSIENKAILAYAYVHAYQYDKAWLLTREVEQAYPQLPDETKENLGKCLQLLYTNLNDFDRQIELCDLQLKSIEKIVGNHHDLYAQEMMLKASGYALKGDYQRSIQLLDSCRNIPNIELSTLIGIYDNMSDVYASMGDFPTSTHYSTVLLNNTDDVNIQRKQMARIIVNMIGELEIRSLDMDEQSINDTDSLRQQLIHRTEYLLAFCRQHFGEGHLNTIEAMEQLASAYYLSGDKKKMLEVVRQCEKQIHEKLNNTAMKKIYLEGLSPYYREGGDYHKALELVDTTSLSRPKLMYEGVRATLELLSELNLDLQRYDIAQYYFKRLVSAIIDETANQMGMLTSKERQYYWRMSRHTLTSAGKYVHQLGEQTPFAGIIYNLALFSKSLLLSSDQAFVRAVRESGSEAMIEKMNLMMNLRTAVVQNADMNQEERAAKSNYATQLEHELLTACQEHGWSGLRKDIYDWRAIQQALADSALAIEMVQYARQDRSECYGAVLLKKGWSAPVFVEVGEKPALDTLQPQQLDRQAGQQVWQFVKPYLSGVKSIYLSPIGVFHSIPIEDMSFDAYDIMSRHFQIHRLSSSQQLLARQSSKGAGVAIFGGLEYGMSVAEMVKDTVRQRGAGDLAELPYLSGTAVEADSIFQIVRAKSKAEPSLYAGKLGTERAFKTLDGLHMGILHIGTHGFYAENDHESVFSSLLPHSQQPMNLEDRTLSKSGLYMAGAECILNQEQIPEGVDDGVLTSQEVSTLNLSGLDLVSLSACQTGQGRITGDGVFGLQRGFKKAGAQSILMSLWKVDDEATSALMIAFYKNWIGEGRTKHDALEQAKQTVRAHKEKGWDAPRYWAAFILLDALD